MSRDFAGSLRLGDGVQEIASFGVVQEHLGGPCHPLSVVSARDSEMALPWQVAVIGEGELRERLRMEWRHRHTGTRLPMDVPPQHPVHPSVFWH